jgi:hypothetical protein
MRLPLAQVASILVRPLERQRFARSGLALLPMGELGVGLYSAEGYSKSHDLTPPLQK